MSAEDGPAALLRQALDNGRVDVLRSLLAELALHGDASQVVDEVGATEYGTLLHAAARRGDADSVRALLSSGANPSLANSEGATPLALADSEPVRTAFVQELLQAVAASKLGRVCQLLAGGVSIEATDSPQSRNRPLHWAAAFGDEAVLRYFTNPQTRHENISLNCIHTSQDIDIGHDNLSLGTMSEAMWSESALSNVCQGPANGSRLGPIFRMPWLVYNPLPSPCDLETLYPSALCPRPGYLLEIAIHLLHIASGSCDFGLRLVPVSEWEFNASLPAGADHNSIMGVLEAGLADVSPPELFRTLDRLRRVPDFAGPFLENGFVLIFRRFGVPAYALDIRGIFVHPSGLWIILGACVAWLLALELLPSRANVKGRLGAPALLVAALGLACLGNYFCLMFFAQGGETAPIRSRAELETRLLDGDYVLRTPPYFYAYLQQNMREWTERMEKGRPGCILAEMDRAGFLREQRDSEPKSVYLAIPHDLVNGELAHIWDVDQTPFPDLPSMKIGVYFRPERMEPWLPLSLVQLAVLQFEYFRTEALYFPPFSRRSELVSVLPEDSVRIQIRQVVGLVQSLAIGLCVASVAFVLEHLRTKCGRREMNDTVLCEGGAKIDSLNAKGETPLHDAIGRGSVELTQKLLEYGADARLRNAKGKDAFDLAARHPDVLQALSRHSVALDLHRSDSVDSLADVSSITSAPTSPTSPMGARRERHLLAQDHKLEHWSHLLWPQPQSLTLHGDSEVFGVGPEGRLRVSFAPGSSADLVRRGMQIWTSYLGELGGLGLSLEWGQLRGTGNIPDLPPIHLSNGNVGNGVAKTPEAPPAGIRMSLVSGIFSRAESYSLSVRRGGVEIVGGDLKGLKNAILTFVQCLRANIPGEPGGRVRLGSLSIRDWPDTAYRSVLLDFTGIRVLAIDSLCALASRLSFLKANQLIVHLEVRPGDKFALPYSAKELFHLRQVCSDLSLALVPSLDLNSRHVEPAVAAGIVDEFLGAFPASSSLHFGENLSPVLAATPGLLEKIHRYGSGLVFLSLESLGAALELGPALPPFAVVCLAASSLLPEPAQAQLAKAGTLGGGVCVRFGTSDVGFLSQAPENLIRNAVLAAKLPGRYPPIIGTMVCDLASGCEIVPPSLASLPELAVLGAAWNRGTDLRRSALLLPAIAAEHCLLDRSLACLFRQLLSLGYVEHELTALGAGPTGGGLGGLSVFVNLLLNPDALRLDRLTPVTFKKARLELQRNLRELGEAKKHLPYRYDLALALAEVQLITELMVLAARIGQALCTHGANPDARTATLPVINVGVANLPLTTRTDLANALLELRGRFQHTWLSRNVPASLPNALKLFDNLFRTLLPPSLQKLGDTLL